MGDLRGPAGAEISFERLTPTTWVAAASTPAKGLRGSARTPGIRGRSNKGPDSDYALSLTHEFPATRSNERSHFKSAGRHGAPGSYRYRRSTPFKPGKIKASPASTTGCRRAEFVSSELRVRGDQRRSPPAPRSDGTATSRKIQHRTGGVASAAESGLVVSVHAIASTCCDQSSRPQRVVGIPAQLAEPAFLW